jgi:hypothetical protein
MHRIRVRVFIAASVLSIGLSVFRPLSVFAGAGEERIDTSAVRSQATVALPGWTGYFGAVEMRQSAPPAAFGKIEPPDVSWPTINPTLSWEASSGAEEYEYCLDVFDNDVCDTSWVSAGTANSVDLSGLGTNNVYFWQVRAVNAEETVYADGGDWWQFKALGQFFDDVPVTHWAWMYIERLYHAAVTGGCSTNPLRFCPNNPVTRAQMALFIVRGFHGSAFPVPPATGTVFADVTTSTWAADWIEQLYADGITGGCGGGNYCPGDPVTRAQMAIFLLRAKNGPSYTPPAATGSMFGDVTLSTWAADWIEQLYAEGITSGCGGGNYCPARTVTRAEMAVFLVRTFNLP